MKMTCCQHSQIPSTPNIRSRLIGSASIESLDVMYAKIQKDSVPVEESSYGAQGTETCGTSQCRRHQSGFCMELGVSAEDVLSEAQLSELLQYPRQSSLEGHMGRTWQSGLPREQSSRRIEGSSGRACASTDHRPPTEPLVSGDVHTGRAGR